MINCKLEDLPVKVRGFVRENDVDDYTVVINARHSAETQREWYKHELDHLKRNELDSDEPADIIELNAHRS